MIDADPLAGGAEGVNGLAHGAGRGAHHHHDPVGVGRAVVLDQAVAAAGALGEHVHGVPNDLGHGPVERVRRLPALEEHVGVLGGAAQHRGVRGEGAAAEGDDVLVGDEGPQVVVGEEGHGVDLVRRAEAVEEVQEGDPRGEGGGVRHRGEVVGLLG